MSGLLWLLYRLRSCICCDTTVQRKQTTRWQWDNLLTSDYSLPAWLHSFHSVNRFKSALETQLRMNARNQLLLTFTSFGSLASMGADCHVSVQMPMGSWSANEDCWFTSTSSVALLEYANTCILYLWNPKKSALCLCLHICVRLAAYFSPYGHWYDELANWTSACRSQIPSHFWNRWLCFSVKQFRSRFATWQQIFWHRLCSVLVQRHPNCMAERCMTQSYVNIKAISWQSKLDKSYQTHIPGSQHNFSAYVYLQVNFKCLCTCFNATQNATK